MRSSSSIERSEDAKIPLPPPAESTQMKAPVSSLTAGPVATTLGYASAAAPALALEKLGLTLRALRFLETAPIWTPLAAVEALEPDRELLFDRPRPGRGVDLAPCLARPLGSAVQSVSSPATSSSASSSVVRKTTSFATRSSSENSTAVRTTLAPSRKSRRQATSLFLETKIGAEGSLSPKGDAESMAWLSRRRPPLYIPPLLEPSRDPHPTPSSALRGKRLDPRSLAPPPPLRFIVTGNRTGSKLMGSTTVSGIVG